ncbi:DUF2007 domain-containing protein [Rhizobiales bacterium]|uniref:putative signal transducing protein n=1 Tax=Hongsoonwoonella zoysiae TaxID=2821844 RepID=UPI0015609B05|nr:DUF2007 domain-containing protein [Hongsoonwoonella zoysiae]NRG18131.1 DUF2007 domain-containing protein [Hongsoonwoonella zoysiae]
MEELIRTNDMVLISFIEALLDEARIEHMVLDTNMSILEGSLGVLPRRVLVEGERLNQAKRVLRDAGLSAEIEPSSQRKS